MPRELEIKELLPFVTDEGEEWVMGVFEEAIEEGDYSQVATYNVRIPISFATPFAEIVEKLKEKARAVATELSKR